MRIVSRKEFEHDPVHQVRIAFKSEEPTLIGDQGGQQMILGVNTSTDMPPVDAEEANQLPTEREFALGNEEAEEWLR
ncbi:hypothetical protein [Streptomyces sp. SID12488]|uniref:hypothetical protein n=1 Tax=Streptomyces sp. SID12488 TaxID=2706040 RepID=UPI0013DA6CFD|nr:hypothetical protein [Streptomyces sp. SID12488]NEA65355.1 hypothetical protein [Streptomyces sp. SID12488]